MQAGDTVYVGPGLYREQVTVLHDGAAGRPLRFVADHGGAHTGDPPGPVMVSGADVVDESTFEPAGAPGVYRAAVAAPVLGVVEMDGPQRRYLRARDTKEAIADRVAEREVVERLPGSHFYDAAAHVLFIHTSDGAPPVRHEIELIHRGSGFAMTDRHFVTITGFVLRHFGDAGISFFKGTSDGRAEGNVVYGGRQGIRVYGATRIVLIGNTLFRNDNSGAYFALQSTGGRARHNVAYENVKGLRWSSDSSDAIVNDNIVFENRAAGIALENVGDMHLRRNHLARNSGTQLMVIRSLYRANDNCFAPSEPGGVVVDFVFGERYAALDAYQRARHQDLRSWSGACAVPPKLDVRKLHAETLAYSTRARAVLEGRASAATTSTGPEHSEP